MHQRKQLERLCRYITRPAIAFERLGCNAKGEVVLQLKSPWRDGTTHIRMSPLEFMPRLAALVPRPRLHLIRFHGVLAPNAGLRAGAHELGAASQARVRHRSRALPALWRRVQAHRRRRSAGADRSDPHAPGLACARPAALPGAAAGPLPGGLILEATAVVQRGRRSGALLARTQRSSGLDLRRFGPIQGSNSHRQQSNLHQTSMRSTVCRAGDALAHGEKGGFEIPVRRTR
jgi:hypothetical protein